MTLCNRIVLFLRAVRFSNFLWSAEFLIVFFVIINVMVLCVLYAAGLWFPRFVNVQSVYTAVASLFFILRISVITGVVNSLLKIVLRYMSVFTHTMGAESTQQSPHPVGIGGALGLPSTPTPRGPEKKAGKSNGLFKNFFTVYGDKTIGLNQNLAEIVALGDKATFRLMTFRFLRFFVVVLLLHHLSCYIYAYLCCKVFAPFLAQLFANSSVVCTVFEQGVGYLYYPAQVAVSKGLAVDIDPLFVVTFAVNNVVNFRGLWAGYKCRGFTLKWVFIFVLLAAVEASTLLFVNTYGLLNGHCVVSQCPQLKWIRITLFIFCFLNVFILFLRFYTTKKGARSHRWLFFAGTLLTFCILCFGCIALSHVLYAVYTDWDKLVMLFDNIWRRPK